MSWKEGARRVLPPGWHRALRLSCRPSAPFHRVLEHRLSVARAEVEPAEYEDEPWIEIEDTRFKRSLLAFFFNYFLYVVFCFLDGLLDFCRAVCGRRVSNFRAQCAQRHGAVGRKMESTIEPGVSSMITSQPVARSKAFILRPSLPIILPLISSLGMVTAVAMVSAATELPMRCIAVVKISLARCSSFSIPSRSSFCTRIIKSESLSRSTSSKSCSFA